MSKVLWSSTCSFFAYFGLFVYHLYKSLSYARDAMYNNHYLQSLAKGLTKLQYIALEWVAGC